ncbi:MAG: BatA domain-containing protein, partial [Verrucomicrobiaceae bacterium]|nr:BatA domain-containing protein [Verrucomicrobiaceae bacterium]
MMIPGIPDFQFAEPWWLLLLTLIPVMQILRGGRGRSAAIQFPNTSLLRDLAHSTRSGLGWLWFSLVLASIAVATLALARP